ncbi:MAG: methyltransferase domain-containing protein [Rhodospirillaceae bacterium]|nr:methyltransferase domain-containing protein [Rhodospirillaceae bacterium]
MEWNAARYATFADERARPGHDLTARIPQFAARRIYDLGCGRGDLTADLAARWPTAQVTGIDLSPTMLADARARFPTIDWVEGDLADWTPDAPADLIFANAALHWLPDHDALFPRLMDRLAPGGVLAVQMPNNFAEPSHKLLRAIAEQGPWADKLALPRAPVASTDAYWRLLRPLADRLDIWETQYLHALTGEDPVLNWVRGTALLPVQERLEGEEMAAFVEAYAEALRTVYTAEATGQTLFTFRRIFIVAVRADATSP